MATGSTAFVPDWDALNPIAVSYADSSPLMPQVISATPGGGYVGIGLQKNLVDILGEAEGTLDPGRGVLVIAVDTLTLAAGTTTIKAMALSIMARRIEVDGGGSAEIIQDAGGNPKAMTQIFTAGVAGGVSFGFAGGAGPAPLVLATDQSAPQVLTVAVANPGNLNPTNSIPVIADFLHSPWNLLALEVTQSAAGVLLYQSDPGALEFAGEMLQWVVAGNYALISQSGSFPSVDFDSVASVQGAALAQLNITQAAASGATFVPILSQGTYEDEINSLLQVAQIYDAKISAFRAQKDLESLLSEFASTLSGISQSAEAPLINTLKRLNSEQAQLTSQLNNEAIKLNSVTEQLVPLQQELVEAIQDEFQKELLQTAISILTTLGTLYVGGAAILIGDPEIATVAAKQAKAALDLLEKAISAGESLAETINSGYTSLGSAPTKADAEAATAGADALGGALAGFGETSALLWQVVNGAITSGDWNVNQPLMAALDKAPNLNGFSIGGLDPAAYWDATVIQTEAMVKPYQGKIGVADTYLTMVELAAAYGKSVADLQMKLLGLFNQGMDALDRLQSVLDAEAQWEALQKDLDDKEAQVNGAIGLLERGYNSVKRDIVVAVDNYRAAFLYQWLQESDVQVNASMDYLQLSSAAQKSIKSLEDVLSGTASGSVRPRQNFQNLTYEVVAGPDGLFETVDGKRQARWTIATSDTALADQLSGNGAIYLTETKFELVGGTQSGEVQLGIEISGSFGNIRNGSDYRFVSQPVSMTNNYRPGDPPTFITTWKFADAAAYMTPTPYTQWTLTAHEAETEGVSAIKMTIAGLFLQNS
ncbi:hypothetical protein [Pararhodospirillum oryzae]|uniref:Uncharacterized protein n=1 Tax=Pararhodospirillum oryzae TaxID=478448 RepID=A0A512H6M6_9PROT|nr:hypothetical protein [Pararhodospirillum oryzae]GEO81116.1 hypothetical protein ROR02_12470 [Pararhodospirillum oryzae]